MIDDYQQLVIEQKKLQDSVAAMELSLHGMRKRVQECEFYITDTRSDHGYDVDQLTKEAAQIKANIGVIETVVASETERLGEATAALDEAFEDGN